MTDRRRIDPLAPDAGQDEGEPQGPVATAAAERSGAAALNVGTQTSRFKAPPEPPRPGMVETDLPISNRSKAYFTPAPGLSGAQRNNPYRPAPPGPIAAAAAAVDPNPVTVAPSALQTRQSPIGNADSATSRVYGAERARGPVEEAAAAAGATDLDQVGPDRSGGRTIDETNDLARAQLNTMRAAEQQNRDAGLQRAGVVATAIQSRMDAERAARDASVANFKATNGADVVLRGQTFGGVNEAAVTARQQADAANRTARDAGAAARTGQIAVDTAPGPNFVAQAAELQRTRLDEQAGQTKQRAGQQALEQGKVNVEQGKVGVLQGQLNVLEGTQRLEVQKRINTLGAQLATETDPAKRARLEQTLLAHLGKDKPEEFMITHAAGGNDPRDLTGARKLPDNIVVTSKRTGKSEIMPLGATPTTVTKADYAKIVKDAGSEDAAQKILKDYGLKVEQYAIGERRTMDGDTREFDGTAWKKVEPAGALVSDFAAGRQGQSQQNKALYPDGTTGTIDGKRVVWKNGKAVPA